MSETVRLTNNLLAVANRYLTKRPQAWSTLGAVAVRDPKFFTRLQGSEAGKSKMTVQAYDTAMQFFSDHWPTDLVWPESVPRPEVIEARQQNIKPRRRRQSAAA